jgi:uncharacterized protein YjbJ (UPF0337 family)
MNKDTVKGTIDDAAGRAKRQVGEWTGDTGTQVDGAAQQVKGKVEKAMGNFKDAAKDATKGTHNVDKTSDMDDKKRDKNFDTDRP